MKYHILFIPIWIINCSQLEKNNSEVFITYSGHSDLERPEPAKAQKVAEKRDKNEKKPEAAEVTEGVVFIPNNKPVFRVGDEMRVDDLMNNRRIDDLMRDVKLATGIQCRFLNCVAGRLPLGRFCLFFVRYRRREPNVFILLSPFSRHLRAE